MGKSHTSKVKQDADGFDIIDEKKAAGGLCLSLSQYLAESKSSANDQET